MEKMQVRFERCKGCGLCVTVCPKKIVALQKEHRNEKGYFTAVCTDQDASAVQCVHRFVRTVQLPFRNKNGKKVHIQWKEV